MQTVTARVENGKVVIDGNEFVPDSNYNYQQQLDGRTFGFVPFSDGTAMLAEFPADVQLPAEVKFWAEVFVWWSEV